MPDQPSPWTLDDEKRLEDIAREFRNGTLHEEEQIVGFADHEEK